MVEISFGVSAVAQPNRDPLNLNPHISQEPLRTGNPPETLADRESVIFSSFQTDSEGRMWGGYFVLIIAAVILAVGGVVIWSLANVLPRVLGAE
jgi:hypothetical protein